VDRAHACHGTRAAHDERKPDGDAAERAAVGQIGLVNPARRPVLA
jgi:hypothetical protein